MVQRRGEGELNMKTHTVSKLLDGGFVENIAFGLLSISCAATILYSVTSVMEVARNRTDANMKMQPSAEFGPESQPSQIAPAWRVHANGADF
jgi:hypothetical protein